MLHIGHEGTGQQHMLPATWCQGVIRGTTCMQAAHPSSSPRTP